MKHDHGVKEARQMEEEEIWRDIPGYDGVYQASTMGRIRRVYSDGKTKYLKHQYRKWKPTDSTQSKIEIVNLFRHGRRERRSVLKLVAETFIGVPEGYMVIHKNGLHSDNRLKNIRIGLSNEMTISARSSRRKPCKKIDRDGNAIAFYTSAIEAAKQNYISRATVSNRSNRRSLKGDEFELLGGYSFRWDE